MTPIYDNVSSRNMFVWATSSIADKKATLNFQSPEVFTILPLMGVREGAGGLLREGIEEPGDKSWAFAPA